MDTPVKTAKEHYDTHLAGFYSWSCGNFSELSARFGTLLEEWHLLPGNGKNALDLGAGHGIQTYALARAGYHVNAVDFSASLLQELQKNCDGFPVSVTEADIADYVRNSSALFDLILCWGDTLLHLPDEAHINTFLYHCGQRLSGTGKLLLSFRNYSQALEGPARFIPVKSDRERILTCVLEYEEKRVKVNDLLHTFDGEKWLQQLSAYYKVRLSPEQVIQLLSENGFDIAESRFLNGQHLIVAAKKAMDTY